MRIESRIARLEDYRHRDRARQAQGVEAMTDAELEAVICEVVGCSPAELTDEPLTALRHRVE